MIVPHPSTGYFLVITAYTIQRDGSARETRFVRSTISNDKLVLIRDDTSKKLWIFTGKSINNEIKRLSSFGIDDLNNDLKYEIVEVEQDEWNQMRDSLFELSKNPQEVKSDNKVEVTNEASNSTTSESTSPSESESQISDIERPKPGFAPLPTSRKPMVKSPEPVEMEKYTEPTPQKPVTKPKAKPIPQTEKKSVTKPFIPQPSRVQPTPETANEAFNPKAEGSTGPMIEEFQIAYYEASGGENFLLIEELSKRLSNNHEFLQIADLIRSINELCDRDATQLTAKKVLSKQLDILIKTIYRH